MSEKSSKSFHQVLEEVEVRFLLNLPESELAQTDRLFFQIEQAHWFYEDFIADKYTNLPHFGLKGFAEQLFKHCALLQPLQGQFHILFDDFCTYRFKIPVYGCIMLNSKMTMVVLVRNWTGNSWGFPKGKVNQSEKPIACAIRETFEETGFDATAHCDEENSLVVYDDTRVTKLFIATEIPEDTVFSAQSRKEISKVDFHPIDNLPSHAWGVYQFLPKLKRWIQQYKKKNKRNNDTLPTSSEYPNHTTNKINKNNKNMMTSPRMERRSASCSHIPKRNNKEEYVPFDIRNADTFGLTSKKKEKLKWNVNQMFETNAKLTGRSFIYNGNPHEFGATHPKYVDYNNINTPNSSSQNNNIQTSSNNTSLKNNNNNESDIGINSTKTTATNTSILPFNSPKRSTGKTNKNKSTPPAQVNQNLLHIPIDDNKKSVTSSSPLAIGRSHLKFQLPFQLDKSAILKAVDDALIRANHSNTLQDMLADD